MTQRHFKTSTACWILYRTNSLKHNLYKDLLGRMGALLQVGSVNIVSLMDFNLQVFSSRISV